MSANRAGMSDGPRVIGVSEWNHGRFVWMDAVREDAQLSSTARLLAHELVLGWTNYKTLRCDPSYRQLADSLGLSEDTVKRAVRALTEAGWLVRDLGHGRGNHTGYAFRIRTRLVLIKGGKRAPLSEGEKGAGVHPFSGSEKGANLHRKGGKSASAHNIAKPYKNHGAGEARSEGLDESARLTAERIREGRPVFSVSPQLAERIIALGLLTRSELRAAGVDC